MRTKNPKTAMPRTLPATSTPMVCQRLRPSWIPSAPSTQLIGAMLAPVQIQNWWAAVEVRARSGTGVRECSATSVTSSESVLTDMGPPRPRATPVRDSLSVGGRASQRTTCRYPWAFEWTECQLSLLLVDVLAHEVFLRAGAEVLTGPVPQGRQVRWVHSTEVYEVAPLLRGGELLLTTGLGLAGSAEQDRRAYVRAVADAGLAALALELGWTFEAMPPDMLAEARDAGLPLVALHSRVPFAEITEAVNSSIVDRSIVRLRYADELSRALSGALLAGADLERLLACLSGLVQAPALLAHPDGRTLAVVVPDGQGPG